MCYRCFVSDLSEGLRPVERLLKENAHFALTHDTAVLFRAILAKLSKFPASRLPRLGRGHEQFS